MGHVILKILYVIGMILLILLCVVAALVFCVLFTPICYRARIKKNDDGLNVKARVSWLFRVVYFSLNLIDNKPVYELYIFGIPLLKILKKRKEKKARKPKRIKKNKKKPAPVQTVKEAEHKQKECASDNFEQPVSRPDTTTAAGTTVPKIEEKKSSVFKKIGSVLLKILTFPVKIVKGIIGFFKKIRNLFGKIKNIYELLQSPETKDAFACVKTNGFKIIKHVKPRKIKGYVHFGLEDPANTGEALGFAAMLYPIFPKQLRLLPDFEQACLDCDVKIRGHVFLIVPLVYGLKILFNKNVRKIMQLVKK